MASRGIACLSLCLLAIGVVGRRAQEESEIPTKPLKAVGTIMSVGVLYAADTSAAHPKALDVDPTGAGKPFPGMPPWLKRLRNLKGIGPRDRSRDAGAAKPKALEVEHDGSTKPDTNGVPPWLKPLRNLKGLLPREPRPAAWRSTARGPIKLTYFGIEGVAEKVRLAFVLGGIEFEDERVAFDQWPAMKPTMKYGALPMLYVGDNAPVAQSGAMLRWAGQLTGLYPPELLLKVEEAIGVSEDMQRELLPSMYIGMRPHIYGYPADMPDEDKKDIQLRLRAKLMMPDGGLPRFLGYLQDFLGESQYMCGDRVTIADCQIIPQLRQLTSGALDGIPTTILDDFPKLKAYFDRFHAIGKVRSYYEKLATTAGE